MSVASPTGRVEGSTAFPTPPSVRKIPARPNPDCQSEPKKGLCLQKTFEGATPLELALASPSTLNTPLHTLNFTAFAIASQAENILPTGPSPRAV